MESLCFRTLKQILWQINNDKLILNILTSYIFCLIFAKKLDNQVYR